MTIPAALYARLEAAARFRCGYCQTSSHVTGQPLSVEHITPIARGGATTESNLWLSCRRCNEFKGAQIEAIDPDTDLTEPLFNPRQQAWREHFAWSEDGTGVVGLTPCGRATVAALRLNNEEIVAARRLWVGVGWHPPRD